MTTAARLRSAGPRTPRWSGALTTPLARAIRPEWRPAALTAIKAVHTAIFASVGAAIALFVWDGIRQRRGRRGALALGVALGETAIYAASECSC